MEKNKQVEDSVKFISSRSRQDGDLAPKRRLGKNRAQNTAPRPAR